MQMVSCLYLRISNQAAPTPAILARLSKLATSGRLPVTMSAAK